MMTLMFNLSKQDAVILVTDVCKLYHICLFLFIYFVWLFVCFVCLLFLLFVLFCFVFVLLLLMLGCCCLFFVVVFLLFFFFFGGGGLWSGFLLGDCFLKPLKIV